jgi:hypothetical protein
MPEALTSSAIGLILPETASPARLREEVVDPWLDNQKETPLAPVHDLVVVGLGSLNAVLDKASRDKRERRALSKVPLLLENGDPNPELRTRILTNVPDLVADLDRGLILLGTAHTSSSFIDGAKSSRGSTDSETSVTYTRPVASTAGKTVRNILIAPSAVTELSLESVTPRSPQLNARSLVFGAKLDTEGKHDARGMFTIVSFLPDTSHTTVVGARVNSINTVSSRPRDPMLFGQWERLDNMRLALRAATPGKFL